MPTKTTKKPQRAVKKPVQKSPLQKSRVVTNRKRPSKLTAFFSSKLTLLLVAVIIGGTGTYLLMSSQAASLLPAADPARGLVYKGLKRAVSGLCKGDYVDENTSTDSTSIACTHPDPGPTGVDLRTRDKQIDRELSKQVQRDRVKPAKHAGEEGQKPTDSADVLSPGSLSAVTGNTWPYVGTGDNGARVQVVYAYKAGGTDRLGSVRSQIESIVRRTNAVLYNSSVANGGQPRQYRFVTETDYSLRIRKVAITGDINNSSNVSKVLYNAGFTSAARKYLVMIDYSTDNSPCGVGTYYPDDASGQGNSNNVRPEPSTNNPYPDAYAKVWHKCWNYAEPHELMHTMGSVHSATYNKAGTQLTPAAPYATKAFHCYDQHDVMCYADGGGGHAQITRCTAAVYKWRYDCGYDTYFNSRTDVTGYLANHWNTANSRFMVHY